MSPWKSPLLLLGILAIMVATAALLAPLFIDWGVYRTTVEAYGKRLTGRDVKIGGKIDAQLFPWPELVLRDVRVANPQGAFYQDLLYAPVLSIELSLPRLLSGQLEMTEVTVDAPTLALERLPDGTASWALEPDRALMGDLGPERLSFPAIVVRGGTASFAHGERGRLAEFEIDTLTASAPALTGPWKLVGNVAHAGQAQAVTFNLGNLRAGEPRTAYLRIAPIGAGGYSYTFDGTFPSDPAAPLTGNLTVTPVESPDGKADAQVGFQPFNLKAEVEAEPSFTQVALSKIEIGPASTEDARNMITGKAAIDFSDGVQIDADLKSPRIELDSLLDAETRQALVSQSMLASVSGVLSALPPSVQMNLRLSVASLVSEGESLDGAVLVASATASSLKINDLSLSMPGQTRLSFTGALVPEAQAPLLSGNLKLASGSLRDFVSWLVPARKSEIERVWSGQRGKLELTGEVEAMPEQLRLNAARLALDDTAATGSLSIRLGTTPAASLRLSAKRLDPGRYVALDYAHLSEQWGDVMHNALRWGDLQLTLQADELMVNGILAQDIAVDVGAGGGAVELRTVEIGEVDGARVTLSGLVKLPEDGLEGSIVGEIGAEDPRGLMRLVGLLPAPGSGQSDPPWARPAKLSVSLRGDARERDGVTTGGIKLEAAYGAANGGLSLKYSGGLEGWRAGSFDVELNGQSPNSRELAAFIGFTPVAGGDEPARFKLTGTGAVESGVVTSAELAIFGSELRFSGSIGDRQGGLVATGRAAILAERVDGLYHALGLPLLDHGPAGRVLSAEGEVDLSRERLEVKSVAGAAAGASFTGSGSLGFLGERLALQASAETGRLDFANTLGLLILPRDGKPVGATQPFASALVDAASLDIDLKSNSLLLVPGLAFKPARFKAKGGAEALTITAEGESLPGRRSVVEATIARDGKGYRLSGSVDIAGDLGNLLLAEDRRGVLIGQAHVTGQFTSSGLSVGGLFAAMGGSGTIALDNGVLRGVDPLAFAGGLESARTPVEIDHLVDSVLRAGELRFKGANAAITMQGGVVSTAPLQIAAEAVDGRLKLMLDTAAAEADVSAMLTLKGIPGEPTFEVAWGGPADALEASYDVSGLKSNISVGVLSKGIDKLEELQREQARLVAEEQAFAREQAVKFTERSLRRQARDFVALEARRKAEEEARREKERQARLLSEATARLKVEELRRLIDEEARRRAALQPSVPPSSPPVGKSELPPLAPVFGSQSSIPAPPDEADPQKARDRAAAKAQDTITEVPPAWPAERKNRDIR